MEKKLITVTLVAAMALTMGACSAKKETTETTTSEAATTEAVNNETTVAATETTSSESENAADTSTVENPHLPKVFGELSYINAEIDTVKKHEVCRLLDLYADEEIGIVSLEEAHDHKKIADMTDEDLQELLDSIDVKMFDSLTSMTMALQSGDIDCMSLYDSVANYICAKNSDLEVEETFNYDYDELAYEDDSIFNLTKGVLSDEFTFMMLEGNESLRDEFNSAIADIKKDGTLTKLTKEFITKADFSTDAPASPEFESFDGADTIKVGVTGDLPPFDYMNEAGEPEGFNKAILTEIGKRIGKNIELVSIDAGSRALALSSGQIDVVFWTRSQARRDDRSEKSNDASVEAPRTKLTHEEDIARLVENGETNEQAEIIAKSKELCIEVMGKGADFKILNSMDSPDGTINTDYFYSAPIVHVKKK